MDCLLYFPHQSLAEHDCGQAHVTFARETGMGIAPGSGNYPLLANTIRVTVLYQKSSAGVSAAETSYSTCFFGAVVSSCGCVEPIKRGFVWSCSEFVWLCVTPPARRRRLVARVERKAQAASSWEKGHYTPGNSQLGI